MIQSRVLRKDNPDAHYTTALHSFLKERSQLYADNCAMVSADAKCKVTLGEPSYPIAAVSRGKRVIVGSRESLQVGDHDFSKTSLIPDAILIQDIPVPQTNDTSKTSETVGSTEKSWYHGQVFYGVKSMVSEGSTAWRCIVELGKTLELEYETIPGRIYWYTDGGGDRRMTFIQVQLAVISLFLTYDADEVIVARTAAGLSFRNPVERCHAIANLGLQGIGLMREKMDVAMEKLMSKCNSNEEIRKICDENNLFEDSVKKSIQPTKELIEDVLQRLSLKDKPFKIFQSASEEEILQFQQTIIDKFDCMPTTTETGAVNDFFQKHCNKRTYYFQVKKCSDTECVFHKPLSSEEKIKDFPDPIPYEENGIPHYSKGSDPKEKYVPSTLLDSSKRPHNVPFSPSAQTAKNAGMTIRCIDCKKQRMIYSKSKLKLVELNQLKRALSGLQYICGSVFSEFDADEGNHILSNVYVRGNLSCTMDMEFTYYSSGIFPDTCVHCGTKQNLVKCVENYPRCRSRECHNKGDVIRRKRKIVTSSDLTSKKKK